MSTLLKVTFENRNEESDLRAALVKLTRGTDFQNLPTSQKLIVSELLDHLEMNR